MKKAGWFVAAALLCAPYVNAEQVKGVEVYPGAKADPSVAQSLEKKMGIKGASTYRTSDPVKKVAEFYRKQGLEEMPGADDRGAMFSKGKTNVTIQRPWMDMDSGKLNNDTLVSVVGPGK
jgi:hypothetical protein